MRADDIVSRLHGGVYTRNRRFIKPDFTATEAPVPKPISEPNVTRPTRTIRSQIDSSSLKKTIINSRDSLETFIYS